jgi:hypothetical protein
LRDAETVMGLPFAGGGPVLRLRAGSRYDQPVT